MSKQLLPFPDYTCQTLVVTGVSFLCKAAFSTAHARLPSEVALLSAITQSAVESFLSIVKQSSRTVCNLMTLQWLHSYPPLLDSEPGLSRRAGEGRRRRDWEYCMSLSPPTERAHLKGMWGDDLGMSCEIECLKNIAVTMNIDPKFEVNVILCKWKCNTANNLWYTWTNFFSSFQIEYVKWCVGGFPACFGRGTVSSLCVSVFSPSNVIHVSLLCLVLVCVTVLSSRPCLLLFDAYVLAPALVSIQYLCIFRWCEHHAQCASASSEEPSLVMILYFNASASRHDMSAQRARHSDLLRNTIVMRHTTEPHYCS